jgi:mono/diheme cytochrome c family protein
MMMNLKLKISFLLPAVFMFLMVACGGSGEFDIDATHEVTIVVESEQTSYEGEVLYLANCATCHGVNLQGNPNWRSGTDKDGQRLPPPLNGTGHTWHHSPKVLHEILKYGLKIYDENYEGKMVGNENLTNKEIYSLLEYIKSVWPEELRTNYTETYK